MKEAFCVQENVKIKFTICAKALASGAFVSKTPMPLDPLPSEPLCSQTFSLE